MYWLKKFWETLEFGTRTSLELFSFIAPLELEENEGMVGLTNLEVYNSIFTLCEKKKMQ